MDMYVIAQPCIDVKDKACVDVCPVDCIHPTDGEGCVPMLYIDPDECIMTVELANLNVQYKLFLL